MLKQGLLEVTQRNRSIWRAASGPVMGFGFWEVSGLLWFWGTCFSVQGYNGSFHVFSLWCSCVRDHIHSLTRLLIPRRKMQRLPRRNTESRRCSGAGRNPCWIVVPSSWTWSATQRRGSSKHFVDTRLTCWTSGHNRCETSDGWQARCLLSPWLSTALHVFSHLSDTPHCEPNAL